MLFLLPLRSQGCQPQLPLFCAGFPFLLRCHSEPFLFWFPLTPFAFVYVASLKGFSDGVDFIQNLKLNIEHSGFLYFSSRPWQVEFLTGHFSPWASAPFQAVLFPVLTPISKLLSSAYTKASRPILLEGKLIFQVFFLKQSLKTGSLQAEFSLHAFFFFNVNKYLGIQS